MIFDLLVQFYGIGVINWEDILGVIYVGVELVVRGEGKSYGVATSRRSVGWAERGFFYQQWVKGD